MIVDTSALIAILKGEPDAEPLTRLIFEAEKVKISAATLVEARTVVRVHTGPVGARQLESLIRELGIEIIPFTAAQADLATRAIEDFGRRSGSPAKLNPGDCCSYALAAETGESLAFVGEDFVHTDVRDASTGRG